MECWAEAGKLAARPLACWKGPLPLFPFWEKKPRGMHFDSWMLKFQYAIGLLSRAIGGGGGNVLYGSEFKWPFLHMLETDSNRHIQADRQSDHKACCLID